MEYRLVRDPMSRD